MLASLFNEKYDFKKKTKELANIIAIFFKNIAHKI